MGSSTVFDAAMLILSQDAMPADAPVIGAGIGESVLREVARRLRHDYVGFDSLLSVAPTARAAALQCAPAAASAILASGV